MKVQEELPKETAKNEEDQVENNGQDSQNSLPSSGDLPQTSRPLETRGVLTSRKGSPGPLGLNLKHPQDSLSENAQMSPVSSSPEGQAGTSSSNPSGDVLPPLKPDPAAAVPSDPTPRCSLLPETSTKEVLREDLPSSFPGSLALRQEKDAEKPSGSNSALASACKRKMSTPPLQGDQGELPPPLQLPCLAVDKNLDTSENTEGQTKKTREDKTEVTADCSATQPAPSSSPPAYAIADTLPQATGTGQGPATITVSVSTHSTSQPTLGDEDIEMDTTPPCCATKIQSSSDSDIRFLPVYQIQYSVAHNHPGVPPPTHPH